MRHTTTTSAALTRNAGRAGLRQRKALAVTVAAMFALFHVGALLPIWVGWSPVALAVAFALYVIRAFGVTAGYHRYFAHRAFKTSRPVQFLLGLAGSLAMQGGLFWWVSHHREHHAGTETEHDVHSPVVKSFWYAHMGWMMDEKSFGTPRFKLKDFAKYPELRFLQRQYAIVILLQAAAIYGLGAALAIWAPELGTNGPQMLAWGLFVSVVALWHSTFMVNSVAHVWGSRNFDTKDNSRNNALVAFLTLGEGWHNNHHAYPASPRHGLGWSQPDPTWIGLSVMRALGLVWGFRGSPERWDGAE